MERYIARITMVIIFGQKFMEAEKPVGHVPVLREQVIKFLQPRPGSVIVDATVGLGGHSRALVEAIGPTGRLVAIDRDSSNLPRAQQLINLANQGCPVDWVHGNFAEIKRLLMVLGISSVDGIMADLGVSSPQLDEPERGFSFRRDGPLDMRMDPTRGESARDLVHQLDERQLAWVFWEYGEERFSRRVAARIVAERKIAPISTTGRLAEIVRAAIPHAGKTKGGARLDPATRVFQALRIAVNDELQALESLLAQLPVLVQPGGRAVIISFHSLEDRRVKNAWRDRDVWEALTKKPVQADETECALNPRSRSAKLRAVQRR